jgi:hypothetical protein
MDLCAQVKRALILIFFIFLSFTITILQSLQMILSVYGKRGYMYKIINTNSFTSMYKKNEGKVKLYSISAFYFNLSK